MIIYQNTSSLNSSSSSLSSTSLSSTLASWFSSFRSFSTVCLCRLFHLFLSTPLYLLLSLNYLILLLSFSLSTLYFLLPLLALFPLHLLLLYSSSPSPSSSTSSIVIFFFTFFCCPILLLLCFAPSPCPAPYSCHLYTRLLPRPLLSSSIRLKFMPIPSPRSTCLWPSSFNQDTI